MLGSLRGSLWGVLGVHVWPTGGPGGVLGEHVWPTGALGEVLGERVWRSGPLGEVLGKARARFEGPRRALETEFSDAKGSA